MKYGLTDKKKTKCKAILVALFVFCLSRAFSFERDFTTMFPIVITTVNAYDDFEIEFLDIIPEGLSRQERTKLLGIKDVEKSEGKDFELFKEQMEGIVAYAMFDKIAGIRNKDGVVQSVITYFEEDAFENEDDAFDTPNGTFSLEPLLYDLVGISCRLIYEGIAIVDDEQNFSPHIQLLLDITQIFRNKEIEENEDKKQ